MRTHVCDMLGIEYPIFGFSHCRDVVAAVSRAGGFGVLGAANFLPEELEQELSWLDANVAGRPYGVDVLLPAKFAVATHYRDPESQQDAWISAIPARHKEFVDRLMEEFDIPPLPDGEPSPRGIIWSHAQSAGREQVEVALRHPIRLVANGLGPVPSDVVREIKARDVFVGALVGAAKHAVVNVQAGADIVIAQGYEAGGHTGEIGGIVLVPEVVAAVHPVPVLAAGGIATGRQFVAARALGADGVWMGSAWLPTVESDALPEVKERYLRASSTDTIRSTEHSGKPARKLRSKWVEAWESAESPGTLPAPLQGILVAEAEARIKRAQRTDLIDAPVGQVVGLLNRPRRVEDVIYEMIWEYIEVLDEMEKAMRRDRDGGA